MLTSQLHLPVQVYPQAATDTVVTAEPTPTDPTAGDNVDLENGHKNEGGAEAAESDEDTNSDDAVAEIDEGQRTAAYVRLASSHLIQMRGPRANTIGFRDMISKETPAEIVPPARLVAIAAAPKTMNSKIRSFDVIKSLYVFLLLPIHLTNLMSWVRKNDTYASTYLPYKTTDHGQEYIMVRFLVLVWCVPRVPCLLSLAGRDAALWVVEQCNNEARHQPERLLSEEIDSFDAFILSRYRVVIIQLFRALIFTRLSSFPMQGQFHCL